MQMNDLNICFFMQPGKCTSWLFWPALKNATLDSARDHDVLICALRPCNIDQWRMACLIAGWLHYILASSSA